MPFTLGVLDPSNWTQSDDLFRAVGSNGDVGDTFTINSYNYIQVTVEDDRLDDGGSDLVSPVTINGQRYRAGEEVENDYEIIFIDDATGLYYRINSITIDDEFVGVSVSAAWDATTGQYVAGPPPVGTTLRAIDGDDLDGRPNIRQFATDSNYTDEQGNDSDIGVNNGVPVCFGADTLIGTPDGETRVADIAVGDLVMTEDGPMPVLWIRSRTVSRKTLADNPSFRPIRVRAGALGNGLPRRDLILSPQHRVLVRSKIAERMFGSPEVLVAVRQLLALPGIDVAQDLETVTYTHFVCEGHRIVFAEGAAAETLYLGTEARKSLDKAALREVSQLLGMAQRPARDLAPGARARRLAERHRKNAVPLYA